MSITVHSAPCWVVLDANGQEAEIGERIIHYTSKAEATEDLADYGDTMNPTPLSVGRLEAPCWGLVTECGYEYDADEDGPSHFVNRSEAEAAAQDAGYRVVAADGRITCSDTDLCRECPHDLAEDFPPAPTLEDVPLFDLPVGAVADGEFLP